MFNSVVARETRDDKRAVELVPVWALFERGTDIMKTLPGRNLEFTPLQNHLEVLLGPLFHRYFPSTETFQVAFDRFEILAALSYAIPAIEKGDRYWTLPGAYGWRHENRQRIFGEIRNSLQNLGDNSPLVTSGIVGKTAQLGLKNLTELEQFVPEFRWH
jgi:hypothetical protein